MQGWIPELDRRERPRAAQRVPCAVWISGRRVTGTVEEVSDGGMLVSLTEEIAAGTQTLVSFTGAGERFLLEATVQNGRPVARSLSWSTQPRFGLRLAGAPPSYRRWLSRLGLVP